ncbi:MAG: hypothetical protein KDK70_21465 [Myxococcales bacterium]|nr:hypothetical protein [Myxococcales bacterium]
MVVLGGSMLVVLALAAPPQPESPRDEGWRYSLAAGITGSVSIGLLFGTAQRGVVVERCSIQNVFGIFPNCPFTGLWTAALGSVGYGLAAAVLAAYGGNGLARRDAIDGRFMSRRRANGFMMGGIGLRVLGAGLLLGSLGLPRPRECGPVSDDAEIESYLGCYARRSYGVASMLSAGLAMRWVGGGLITYGARHKAQPPPVSVTPFVRPGRNAALIGIDGRF